MHSILSRLPLIGRVSQERAPDRSGKGPQLLDPKDLQRVAGGLPKGGWGSAEMASVSLPKGGW